MLNIKEHGRWEVYQPEQTPEKMTSVLGFNIIFVRRVSDHQDWYELVRSDDAFDPDSVKMTVYDAPAGYQQVMAVTSDVSKLCPQGSLVLEVWGIDDADPQAAYGGMEYVPETNTFRPAPPPVPETVSRRQFFQQLAMPLPWDDTRTPITQAEALAAVQTGTIPAELQELINELPQEQQFGVTMAVAGSSSFDRHNPQVTQLGEAFGWTSAEIDQFWIAAAAL